MSATWLSLSTWGREEGQLHSCTEILPSHTDILTHSNSLKTYLQCYLFCTRHMCSPEASGCYLTEKPARGEREYIITVWWADTFILLLCASMAAPFFSFYSSSSATENGPVLSSLLSWPSDSKWSGKCGHSTYRCSLIQVSALVVNPTSIKHAVEGIPSNTLHSHSAFLIR